jgi:hypothetical protein
VPYLKSKMNKKLGIRWARAVAIVRSLWKEVFRGEAINVLSEEDH